jgi:hypothetical protein
VGGSGDWLTSFPGTARLRFRAAGHSLPYPAGTSNPVVSGAAYQPVWRCSSVMWRSAASRLA